MSLVQLTLKLFGDSLREAAKAFRRTAWAIVVLIAFWIVMLMATLAMSPFGIAGGLVLFLVSCVLTGMYLSMVEVGVVGQRVLRPGDLSDHAGQHWQMVASVGFVFWIPTLLLQFTVPPPVFTIIITVAAIVFNPVPEMIYQDRHDGGLAILKDAMNFMQRNWPEWLTALTLVTLPYLGFWALLYGGWSIELLILSVQTFGPFFGFVEGGAGVMMMGPMAALSLIVAPIVHFVMLFRGQLYRRLRHSNRRQRAWQAKF